MKDDILQIGEALRGAVTSFLIPIQTTREIDHAAFANLHKQALLLVHACKGTEEISKSLLRELLGVYSILRAEAPHYAKEGRILEEMADKIESCFRYIIANETPEERQPGVPRIL